MKKSLIASSALALSLMLVSCSGGSDTPAETAPGTPSAGESVAPAENADGLAVDENLNPTTGDASRLTLGQEFFFVSNSNAVGKFDLPSEPNAKVEEFRKSLKADPATYVKVEIDNRQGADYANMYALTGYGADGAKYEFVGLDTALEEWRDASPIYGSDYKVDSPEDILMGDITDSINLHMEGVDAGMVGEIWMVSQDELPDEFTQITAEVHGAGDPTYVATSTDGQGLDLTFEVPKKNQK